MVSLKNGSRMKSIYDYYMNIGLFGTYFNLILDRKVFQGVYFWNIASLFPWGR